MGLGPGAAPCGSAPGLSAGPGRARFSLAAGIAVVAVFTEGAGGGHTVASSGGDVFLHGVVGMVVGLITNAPSGENRSQRKEQSVGK